MIGEEVDSVESVTNEEQYGGMKMKLFTKAIIYPFLAGVGATVVATKAIKSKCVHDAAVRTVAKALEIRDEAARAVNLVKEEAEDIYAEAKASKKTADEAEMDAQMDAGEACSL